MKKQKKIDVLKYWPHVILPFIILASFTFLLIKQDYFTVTVFLAIFCIGLFFFSSPEYYSLHKFTNRDFFVEKIKLNWVTIIARFIMTFFLSVVISINPVFTDYLLDILAKLRETKKIKEQTLLAKPGGYYFASSPGSIPRGRKIEPEFSEEIELHIDRGKYYMMSRRTNEAFNEYNEIIEKLDPDNFIAHYNLGVLYSMKNEQKKAIEEYKKAIEVNPEDPQVHNCLGVSYNKEAIKAANLDKEKMLKDAENAYKKSVELNRSYAEGYCNLGTLYYEKREYSAAAYYYQKALKYKLHFLVAKNNLGLTYYHRNRLDESIKILKEVIEIDQDYTESYHNLGVNYYARYNIDEAIKFYKKSIEKSSLQKARPLDPYTHASIYRTKTDKQNEGITHKNLGDVYHIKRDFKRALKEYRLCKELYPKIGSIREVEDKIDRLEKIVSR